MIPVLALSFAIALTWVPLAHAGGVRIIDEGGLQVFGERRFRVVSGSPSCWDHRGQWRCAGRPTTSWRPHHHHVRTILVVPRAHCLVPGYWTYHWVPQTSWYNVWVPGHYTPEFNWIEGHYEQRPYTTGYYQPLWVPERWAC